MLDGMLDGGCFGWKMELLRWFMEKNSFLILLNL